MLFNRWTTPKFVDRETKPMTSSRRRFLASFLTFWLLVLLTGFASATPTDTRSKGNELGNVEITCLLSANTGNLNITRFKGSALNS
ncbi:MAG: hypothetical protein LBP94_02055 [Zoogloeaceae bacterium]|jgi:hypothetical protein|nr:hypothetical protein [Zoogloeaceae bacterium]